VGGLRVKVSEPLQLEVFDAQGGLLVRDRLRWSHPGFEVERAASTGEHIYGLGDKTGPLDRIGHSYTCWTYDPALWQESSDPLYKSLPFFLSMRGPRAQATLLNNSYRSTFDFAQRRRDAHFFGAEGGPLDYTIFTAPQLEQVLEDYTAVSGRMPLPPRYALGYQQSRGSYVPQAKLLEVARRLRAERIPCDVLYLDGDYRDFGGPFTVDRKAFPDFAGSLSEVHRLGFKVIASLDPYLRAGSALDRDGLARGYFVTNPDGSVYNAKVWDKPVHFLDFSQPAARQWWGELHRKLLDEGVDGIWNDMNEPAVGGRPDRTIPLDARHGKRLHREIHNLFAYYNTQATYEGLRRLRPKERPFVLTRSGTVGSCRFAATWTGDNTATWNHLRISVPQMLNLGLSGWSFSGADVGGYNGFATGPSPELLTRWMQLGAFSPLFRNHSDGCTRAREPWVDGPEHLQARRAAIELRYRLMPYLYTWVEDTARRGVPWMRPLFFADPSLAGAQDAFLIGPSLLVAPRVWEMAGAYPVVLPKGNWYAFDSAAVVSGVQSVDPALNQIPLYVKAGSIIPEVQDETLNLRVYPDAQNQAQGRLYWDDGLSFDYANGNFCRLELAYSNGELKVTRREGNSRLGFSSVTLQVVGQPPRPLPGLVAR